MTNQPKSKLDRLITILGENELKLTGTEIADILWLILQNRESTIREPVVISPTPKDITKDIPATSKQNFSTEQHSEQQSFSADAHLNREPDKPLDNNTLDNNTLPIKIPDAKSLSIIHEKEIIRALRLLMQKIPFGMGIIDEQETAERSAEEHIPIPILKPAQELPFDLALVVDESDSMIFWRQTIQELQQLLKKYRVFRDVQTWKLVRKNQAKNQAKNQTTISLRRGIGKQSSKRQYNISKLNNSSDRLLILIVSDCIGNIWHNGEILSVLATWVKYNPVAILQMLPESMWLRTGLTLGTKVQLGNSRLGAANQGLSIKKVLLGEDIKTGIKVPVFTLESAMLETWSEMLIGKGSIGAGGFVFNQKLVPKTPKDNSQKQELPKDNSQKQDLSQQNLTGEERAYRFLMIASPMARNLASLLASAPLITLPIVRIIQEKFLPRSQPIHVAEVFIEGILKTRYRITPKTNPDRVEYIFFDDDEADNNGEKIRDILLKNAPKMDSLYVIDAVSDAVSDFVRKSGDQSLKGFYALLKKPEELEEKVDQAKKAESDLKAGIDNFDLKRFARITTKVLKRLGGSYQRFAEEVETAFRKLANENDIVPDIPVIELKSFDFEFATIILIDDSINTQTFNFKVGFIKVNQDDNNDIDILEIINRELFNQKNRYLNDIEELLIKGTLENQTYKQILESQNRSESENHLKSISRNLWNLLTDIFGENVNKSNVKSVVEQWVNGSPGKATGFIEHLDNNIQLEMMLIPGGTFVMGSPPDELKRYEDESPQHNVTVQPFFFGKYPVTQAQWKFVARLPQVKVKLKPDPSHFKGANRPVENVSWDDAVEFCDRLSSHTKKSYRLPSEAEWEYACRAGTTTPFHFGETISTDLANYDGNYIYGNGVEGIYRQETTDAGSFGITNNFGLYDMHGNVLEWCQDQYHDSYVGAPTDGSTWLSENDNQIRMLRGGSWNNNPEICRSAYRYDDDAGGRYGIFGFRVVCSGART